MLKISSLSKIKTPQIEGIDKKEEESVAIKMVDSETTKIPTLDIKDPERPGFSFSILNRINDKIESLSKINVAKI